MTGYVQVHPDDAYGREHEGELGKTECWYIISAEEGSEIVYGHQAKSKEDLRAMIEAGAWDDLLTRVPVKAGDFFLCSKWHHACDRQGNSYFRNPAVI